jgi:hypothetical protein
MGRHPSSPLGLGGEHRQVEEKFRTREPDLAWRDLIEVDGRERQLYRPVPMAPSFSGVAF